MSGGAEAEVVQSDNDRIEYAILRGLKEFQEDQIVRDWGGFDSITGKGSYASSFEKDKRRGGTHRDDFGIRVSPLNRER